MQLETRIGLIVLSKTSRESLAAGGAGSSGGETDGDTGTAADAGAGAGVGTGAAAGRGVAQAAPSTTATTTAAPHGRIDTSILPPGPRHKSNFVTSESWITSSPAPPGPPRSSDRPRTCPCARSGLAELKRGRKPVFNPFAGRDLVRFLSCSGVVDRRDADVVPAVAVQVRVELDGGDARLLRRPRPVRPSTSRTRVACRGRPDRS